MDYLGIAREMMEQDPAARTLRGQVGDQVFWVKRCVESKCTMWHAGQKVMAGIFRSPILRVTAVQDGAQALKNEANRLRQFKAHGVFVPDILAQSDDALVLADSGVALTSYLNSLPPGPARADVLRAAAVALAHLHNVGLVHGRPYLRDMLWNNGAIGFLDLEEDPSKTMPVDAAQSRDIWIFLCAAARFVRDPNGGDYDVSVLRQVYAAYEGGLVGSAPAGARTLARRIRPLGAVIERTLWRFSFIGKDVRHAVVATKCLAEIPE